MKLFFGHPAKARKMRIQRQKCHLATSRKSEANKKPFHWGRNFVWLFERD
jgi:hypothetical protein